MSELPPIAKLTSDADTLDEALSLLFEPSSVLHETLVPALSSTGPAIESYDQLIDHALSTIRSWDPAQQALFIAAHPRIGAVTNLSAMSAAEQAAAATPQDVLERLQALNALYEQRFTGLRYITFVNGRSRAEVAQDMEKRSAGWPVSRVGAGDPRWDSELERAVEEVGLIAKSRVGKLEKNE
ncbi:hypothetical protein AURDEDRAFT_183589 [Auricularia subglabra TFB-10046 SS5]|nr:hypothetical protein AURDEDRAFT_183589 [Auricularia subglabra TFB-10046 SS5]